MSFRRLKITDLLLRASIKRNLKRHITYLDVPQLVFSKLNEARSDLNASEFLADVFRGLEESSRLLDSDQIVDILCYGLGNFSDNRQARYQLALLLILKDRLKPSEVCFYDPLFFKSEIRYLETSGCRVLLENEEGKRRIRVTTLAYFPHCPKQLTNNFLFANWGLEIKNSILFSNSFKLILESHTSDTIGSTAAYINKINPYTREIELRNSFKYTDIFNDSSIHIFTEDSLRRVPESFWKEREEPVYSKDDIEFVTNIVTQS